MVINVQNGVVSGGYAESRKLGGNEEKNGEVQNGCVFGGNINQKLDPVAVKKEQAQKKAMQLWTDAVDAQQKIDMDMDEYAQHMDKLRGLMEEAQGQINYISGEQEALIEQYEVEDLAEELQNNPKGEFASRYNELEEAKGLYREQLEDCKDEYLADSNVLKGMKAGRLKSHAMIDAQNQKDEMMIAASKEVADAMMEQVKEKLEEEQAEREEKAAKKAEKEELEEERLEAIREDKKEQQDEEEESFDVVVTEGLLKLDDVKNEVKQEVQKMVNDMKLLEEDLKGAAVDTQL